MDVNYAYYTSAKGFRVVGGTAAHYLKADGSSDAMIPLKNINTNVNLNTIESGFNWLNGPITGANNITSWTGNFLSFGGANVFHKSQFLVSKNRMLFRTVHGNNEDVPFNEIYHSGNFTPSNYALTTQLNNYIPNSQKGAVNGVPTLDSNREIPNSQIPTRLSDKVIAIGGESADGSFTGLYDRNQLALADKEHTASAILTGAGTFNEALLLDIIFNSKSDFATIANVDTTTVLTVTVTFSAILNNYSRGQWQPFIQQRLGNDRAFRRVKVEIQDWVTNNWITMHDVSNMPIINKSGLWLPNESSPGTSSIRAVRFTLSEPNSFNGIVFLSNIGLRHLSHSFTPQFLHRGENNVLYGTTTVKKQIINQVATGIAPMQISSTTLVDNLNADLLDGKHASDFSLSTHNHNGVYEPVFSKNTAFNKNFGTTANTIAQGNDSRINNGQTAFSWGDHQQFDYAKKAGNQNFTGNNTFTQPLAVGNPSALNHAVNIAYLYSTLGSSYYDRYESDQRFVSSVDIIHDGTNNIYVFGDYGSPKEMNITIYSNDDFEVHGLDVGSKVIIRNPDISNHNPGVVIDGISSNITVREDSRIEIYKDENGKLYWSQANCMMI